MFLCGVQCSPLYASAFKRFCLESSEFTYFSLCRLSFTCRFLQVSHTHTPPIHIFWLSNSALLLYVTDTYAMHASCVYVGWEYMLMESNWKLKRTKRNLVARLQRRARRCRRAFRSLDISAFCSVANLIHHPSKHLLYVHLRFVFVRIGNYRQKMCLPCSILRL